MPSAAADMSSSSGMRAHNACRPVPGVPSIVSKLRPSARRMSRRDEMSSPSPPKRKPPPVHTPGVMGRRQRRGSSVGSSPRKVTASMAVQLLHLVTPWLDDACALVDAFRAKELSPLEALDECLAAIDASQLN